MRIARAFCIPFLAAGLAFGAIDGTVTNGTSNQPQPNVTLTLGWNDGAPAASLQSLSLPGPVLALEAKGGVS